MERPSHIIFDTQSRHFSHRLPFIGLAISLQVAMLWLFTYGLINHWRYVGPPVIHFVPIPEKQTPQAPPPPLPPIRTQIDETPLPPPIFNTASEGPRNTITSTSIAPTAQPPAAAGPDRAPVSITATHTVPPYPPIARRIGAEGKVTLRLTVTPEGRVSEAEIVTSSGRDDLDQTARQWILAHWAYKPALANGTAVASKTLASVTFSLINEH